uniref:hypothetical protein n=1 Tax=Vreelandella venusta TaxID=44935 RepID=UPI001557192F|nr:hypothetical protein [Halomonas hydrothermalis]
MKEVRRDHPYRLNAFGSRDAGLIGYVEEGQALQLPGCPHEGALGRKNAILSLPDANKWTRVEIFLIHVDARGE